MRAFGIFEEDFIAEKEEEENFARVGNKISKRNKDNTNGEICKKYDW